MNAITSEAITKNFEAAGLVAHPTTVARIQSVLKPYADVVEQAQDLDALKAWLPAAYPGNLGPAIVALIDEFEKTETIPEEKLKHGKELSFTFLLEQLVLSLDKGFAETFGDNVITPWGLDQLMTESKNPFAIDLVKLLQLHPTGSQLPINVVVENQPFAHNVDEEFLAGLLLFSATHKKDFQVSFLGVPFTPEYVANDKKASRFSFNEKNPLKYTVTVGTSKYSFSTPSFMQGFATGAAWSNIDHHKYWTALTEGDKVLTF